MDLLCVSCDSDSSVVAGCGRKNLKSEGACTYDRVSIDSAGIDRNDLKGAQSTWTSCSRVPTSTSALCSSWSAMANKTPSNSSDENKKAPHRFVLLVDKLPHITINVPKNPERRSHAISYPPPLITCNNPHFSASWYRSV